MNRLLLLCSLLQMLACTKNLDQNSVAKSGELRIRALATGRVLTAASCNQPDVLTALNSAIAGDTVIIPAGVCHWTQGISYFEAPPDFTILGEGDLTKIGGGDATVIVDDFLSGQSLLGITTHAQGIFRVAGLTIRGGTGSLKEGAIFGIGGLSKQMRIDHIHIDMWSYSTPLASKPMFFSGWLNGVVDHIIVDMANPGMTVFQANRYGDGLDGGDKSFAAATGFGTDNFIFVEDSQFNGRMVPGTRMHHGAVSDCSAGGRFVLRYNNVVGAGVGQTHPTGGASRGRGCRAHEVYGNVAIPLSDFDPLVDQPPYTFDWMSSGVAMIWGNSANGTFSSFIHFDSMRKNNATYTQQPTPSGWGYCGTEFTGVGSLWDGNLDPVTGYPCLDQPGQGRSDLLTGDFPNATNTRTGTMSWPNQELEPVYEWLNSFTAVRGWGNDTSNRGGNAAETRIAQNRDYYLSTPSFDGTSGVGVGTRAQRPATCTKGVSYWSTDQGGNWNKTNLNLNDGTLDVCSATNTWTNSYYTPFTYPHPLTGSNSNPTSTPNPNPTPNPTSNPTSTPVPTPTPVPTTAPTPSPTPVPTSQPSSVSLISITPSVVKAGTAVSATINGSGLALGASVIFENGSGPMPSVSQVQVASDGKSLTFVLKTKPGGPARNRVFDIAVRNPDGAVARLIRGLTVTP